MSAQASLVVTIDTEPDNQWSMPVPGGPARELTFANTRGLSRLVDFLDTLGAPGTWLTSYSVARDAESVRQLRRAAASGHEIGGHLHAWETPPFTDADTRAHPYIFEYDPAVRLAKLRSVTDALSDAFGARPVSYRAGRWGIDPIEMTNLAELGYRVDTSVVPGHDFSRSKGLTRGGPDFRRYLTASPAQPHRVGDLWEAPASATALGLLGPTSLGALLSRGLSYRLDLPSRLAGRVLRETRLTGLVWVRPLLHTRSELVRAAVALAARGALIINVMFHSSEAYEGTSPRSRGSAQVERFYGDLGAIVEAVKSLGHVRPRTLRDAIAAL